MKKLSSTESLRDYRASLQKEQKSFNEKCDKIHREVLGEFEQETDNEKKQEVLSKQQKMLDEAYAQFRENIQKKDQELLHAMEMADRVEEKEVLGELEDRIASA